MKININDNNIEVSRESMDKKIYTESGLLYTIKQELNKQGYDLIKKRMYKDGHLVADTQQYLRTRKKGYGMADIYIYDALYATRNAAIEYNKGPITLSVIRNVFDK